MSVVSVVPGAVGRGNPPANRRFGQPGANAVNPGGKRPKGLAQMRRTLRFAFEKSHEGRALTQKAIALARGDDIQDLVDAVVAAVEAGDHKAVQAAGSVLVAARTTQLKAIAWCKDVGFGKENASLDEETIRKLGLEFAHQMIEGMIAEAETRKVDAGDAPIDTTATSVTDVGTDE
jgi:hypothetical protein